MPNLAPEHHLTPAAGSTTWQMPAEWAPHERCLMAWPTRESLWGPYFEEAKAEYAATANAIGQFEPVLMITNPGQAREVRAACGGAVEVVELAIDDSWIRDSGPLIVADRTGRLAGVDFGFNSWGERFLPYDQDATISRRILEVLGIERMPSDTIMEGGSITVDGEGTLITTEQCLLNVNRNPAMSRADIEAELKGRLGVSKVIWLPYGHHDDAHTDGHVDGVCTYVRPGVVRSRRTNSTNRRWRPCGGPFRIERWSGCPATSSPTAAAACTASPSRSHDRTPPRQLGSDSGRRESPPDAGGNERRNPDR